MRSRVKGGLGLDHWAGPRCVADHANPSSAPPRSLLSRCKPCVDLECLGPCDARSAGRAIWKQCSRAVERWRTRAMSENAWPGGRKEDRKNDNEDEDDDYDDE